MPKLTDDNPYYYLFKRQQRMQTITTNPPINANEVGPIISKDRIFKTWEDYLKWENSNA